MPYSACGTHSWCKNMSILCRPTELFLSNANNYGSTYLYCMHWCKKQNGTLCQRHYKAQAGDSAICLVNVLWCTLNQKENLPMWYLSINTKIELFCKIDGKTILAFFFHYSPFSLLDFLLLVWKISRSSQDREATASLTLDPNTSFLFLLFDNSALCDKNTI